MKIVLIALALFATSSASAFSGNTNEPITNSIEYYTTDTCTGPIIGISDQAHSCDLLAQPPAMAWSTRINGVCLNIVDMPAVEACQRFSNIDFSTAVYFYTSDTCTSTITAVIDAKTSCDSLSTERSVWSIFKGNRCMNIVDTNEVIACNRFR